MVRRLLRLRDALGRGADGGDRTADVRSVQTEAMAAVNDYFERALTVVPSIRGYLDGVAASRGARV
jgi:hypothetical protein